MSLFELEQDYVTFAEQWPLFGNYTAGSQEVM